MCENYEAIVEIVFISSLLIFLGLVLVSVFINSKIKNVLSDDDSIEFGFFSAVFDSEVKKQLASAYKNNKKIAPYVNKYRVVTWRMSACLLLLFISMLFMSGCGS